MSFNKKNKVGEISIIIVNLKTNIVELLPFLKRKNEWYKANDLCGTIFFSRKENLIVTLVIHSYIIRTSDKVPHEEVPENHKTIVIDNDSN